MKKILTLFGIATCSIDVGNTTVFSSVNNSNGLYTKMEICICVKEKKSNYNWNNF